MTEILQKYPYLKSKLENSEKLCVAICTPLYGGIGMIDYFTSLMDTISLLKSVGIGCEFFNLKYESLVQRGRNTLCALALNKPEVTHVFFIDGDIKWKPNDVLKLLNDDKPLVGGLYPKKAIYFERVKNVENILQRKNDKLNVGLSDEQLIKHNLVNYNLNYSDNRHVTPDGLLEVKHIATGFMMIKREVFITMQEKHPEWKYIDDIHINKIPNLYAYFDCFILNGQYLSEDWGFCERWKDCGGKIYADLTVELTHIGTISYEGRILSTLKIE